MFREALLKITEDCPCKCAFCDAHEKFSTLRKEELSDLEWIELCEDLVKNNVEVVILSGGEALLRESLIYKLIRLLSDHGVYVVLNTSGVLFNSPGKIDMLLKNYPSLLVFSVDSCSESIHDSNRGINGLLQQVCDSISYIKSKGEFPVAIRTVITRSNYCQLPEIMTRFYKLGVDCIKFTHIEDDYSGDFLLSERELQELKTGIKPELILAMESFAFDNEQLRHENISKINRLFCRENVTDIDYANSIFAPQMTGAQHCDLIERFITVQSNGEFLPCCEAEHHGWPSLGNFHEHNIRDILKSDVYLDLLDNRQCYCMRCTEWDNFQIDLDTVCRKVSKR